MIGSRYVVKGEHTLGLIIESMPGWMGVLQGSVLKGGHDWRNGPTLLGDDFRPAKREDFEAFRVCPKGHLSEIDP